MRFELQYKVFFKANTRENFVWKMSAFLLLIEPDLLFTGLATNAVVTIFDNNRRTAKNYIFYESK